MVLVGSGAAGFGVEAFVRDDEAIFGGPSVLLAADNCAAVPVPSRSGRGFGVPRRSANACSAATSL